MFRKLGRVRDHQRTRTGIWTQRPSISLNFMTISILYDPTYFSPSPCSLSHKACTTLESITSKIIFCSSKIRPNIAKMCVDVVVTITTLLATLSVAVQGLSLLEEQTMVNFIRFIHVKNILARNSSQLLTRPILMYRVSKNVPNSPGRFCALARLLQRIILSNSMAVSRMERNMSALLCLGFLSHLSHSLWQKYINGLLILALLGKALRL